MGNCSLPNDDQSTTSEDVEKPEDVKKPEDVENQKLKLENQKIKEEYQILKQKYEKLEDKYELLEEELISFQLTCRDLKLENSKLIVEQDCSYSSDSDSL